MAGRLLCFPRQLGLSQVPTPFHSDYSWDQPERKDRRRLLRGMRQKKVVAYARGFGFCLPVSRCDKTRDNRPDLETVGRRGRTLGWVGEATSCEPANCDLTFTACNFQEMLARMFAPRGESHSARGSWDRVLPPPRRQPQKRRDLSSLTRVFMRQSGVERLESEPSFTSLREMCPPEPRQTKQGR